MTDRHDEAIESYPEPGQDGGWSKFFAVGEVNLNIRTYESSEMKS